MKKQFALCNKCGLQCYWDTNRHGKRYLAVSMEQQYEGGTGHWKQPHICLATPEEALAYQASLESAKNEALYRHSVEIAEGKIVVGQTVKVYRGRKVPQGTIGVVFWVADEEDQWFVWKIGFKTEQGDKHFINVENVDFYFDGADALNDKRVAEAKELAQKQRKLAKEAKLSGVEIEI